MNTSRVDTSRLNRAPYSGDCAYCTVLEAMLTAVEVWEREGGMYVEPEPEDVEIRECFYCGREHSVDWRGYTADERETLRRTDVAMFKFIEAGGKTSDPEYGRLRSEQNGVITRRGYELYGAKFFGRTEVLRSTCLKVAGFDPFAWPVGSVEK